MGVTLLGGGGGIYGDDENNGTDSEDEELLEAETEDNDSMPEISVEEINRREEQSRKR